MITNALTAITFSRQSQFLLSMRVGLPDRRFCDSVTKSTIAAREKNANG